MKSPYPYSFGFKRYQTFDYFLKTKFGGKIAKLPVDGGFTCPNIDGSRGLNGCIYCSSRGSGDFAANESLSVTEQLCKMQKLYSEKWELSGVIAYFQAHTNTYAPTEHLRKLFEEALAFPGTVGLAVATRADCISAETADMLALLAKRTYLTVELGLQTVSDKTAMLINRCHSYEEFLAGYSLLSERNINICVHIINGLPGENREMMLDTARAVAALCPHSVKIHNLYVLKGTRLAEMYAAGETRDMTMTEYVNIVCDQLELLLPDTIIERLTGDGKREDLISPLWSLKKTIVINEIDKELLRRNSMQGKNYPENV